MTAARAVVVANSILMTAKTVPTRMTKIIGIPTERHARPWRMCRALLLCAALTACGDDHGHPHAGEDAHGHDHGGGIVITDFTGETELFVEFPALAVGRESPFAAHFTRLDSFEPVDSGRLVVRLSGGGAPDETFEAGPADTPGIFRPVAKPRNAVMRNLSFELQAEDFTAVHRVGQYQVYESAHDADHAAPAEEREAAGLIPFLKEQQWKVDFAIAPVVVRQLSGSVPAPGVLSPAPGGEAYLVAQTDGIVRAGGDRFPQIGDQVEAGQIVAWLSPHLGGEQDYAGIVAERVATRAAHDAARADRARVEDLLAEGAVSRRRLEEAQAAERSARARLDAANARLEAVEGNKFAEAGFAVRAPVAGRIVQVAVGRGQFVKPGDPMFRIVDLRTLRLIADVAEIDAVDMHAPTGAWFTPTGGEEIFELTPGNSRLIAAGGAVDPVKRTVPVVFEFENPDRRLRASMSVSSHIRTGTAFEGPSIPASAVIDDAGQSVVFVMADAENWERRVVRIAVRDGSYVGIATGIEPGERVASRGAYLIYLAATGPAEAGHGHAH